jgi:uncharacterized protein YukJ
MPLPNYGVLKGRLVKYRPEVRGETPHFQLLLDAGGSFRVSVSVRSGSAPEHAANLLHLIDPDLRHPVVAGLAELDDGFRRLPSRPGGLALDYVRGGLFDPRRMRPLPPDRAGPENDLTDALARLARAALADERVRLYAFGDRWGPEPGKPDDVFGFAPGNGLHDLHMNQGNLDRHAPDNGPWQDGALLAHLPADDRWVAIFLAFQTQVWETDDRTGAALRRSRDGRRARADAAASARRPRDGRGRPSR